MTTLVVILSGQNWLGIPADVTERYLLVAGIYIGGQAAVDSFKAKK